MVNVAKANHGCRKVVQYKHGLVLHDLYDVYHHAAVHIKAITVSVCSGFQGPCRVIMCNSHTTQQVKFDRNASAREVETCVTFSSGSFLLILDTSLKV
jgi:hypothetical protein